MSKNVKVIMQGKKIILLTITLVFIAISQLQAQSPNVLVSDLRLKLLTPENSNLDADLVIGIMEDAKFMQMLHDSIRYHITKTMEAGSVSFNVNCFQYMLGLANKPFQYKKIDPDGADMIIFMESAVGITEVSKEDEYSIVTTVKVMNPKKKKLFKGLESEIIYHLHDGSPEISQKEFRQAYLRSISKAISIITFL